MTVIVCEPRLAPKHFWDESNWYGIRRKYWPEITGQLLTCDLPNPPWMDHHVSPSSNRRAVEVWVENGNGRSWCLPKDACIEIKGDIPEPKEGYERIVFEPRLDPKWAEVYASGYAGIPSEEVKELQGRIMLAQVAEQDGEDGSWWYDVPGSGPDRWLVPKSACIVLDGEWKPPKQNASEKKDAFDLEAMRHVEIQQKLEELECQLNKKNIRIVELETLIQEGDKMNDLHNSHDDLPVLPEPTSKPQDVLKEPAANDHMVVEHEHYHHNFLIDEAEFQYKRDAVKWNSLLTAFQTLVRWTASAFIVYHIV